MDTFIMVLPRIWLSFWLRPAEFPSFPDLSLVEQFPCICRQTADRIELKFGKQTHQGSPLANFWSRSYEFPLFPGLRLVEQFPRIFRQTAGASPGLINLSSCFIDFPPFPNLSLIEQFPHIFRQTADWIELLLLSYMVGGLPRTD